MLLEDKGVPLDFFKATHAIVEDQNVQVLNALKKSEYERCGCE